MRRFFYTLFALLLLCSGQVVAQYGTQFENSGLENWANYGSNSDSFEPLNWHSTKSASGTFSGLLKKQLERSNIVRPGSSGSHSAKIFATTVAGVCANGNFTNGRMNAGGMSATSDKNYNYTQRSNNVHCTSIATVPDSVTVWVSFQCSNANQKAMLNCVVHGDADYKVIADGTQSPTDKKVAEAVRLFTRQYAPGSTQQWTRLTVPFNNVGPSTDPRYILMILTTSEGAGQGSSTDNMFIDDFLLVYNPTVTTGTIAQTHFTPGAAIQVPFTLTGTMSANNLNKDANRVIAQLSNANGSFANPIEIGSLTTNSSGTINATLPATLPNGTGYRVRVVTTNYPMTAADNGVNLTIQVPTHTLSLASNPVNGGTLTGAGTYNHGETVTISATANSGYVFDSWTANGETISTNATYSFALNSDMSITANFTRQYQIAVNVNPANAGTVTGAGTYNAGSQATLTATANNGYVFERWTINGESVSTSTSYTFTVNADVTVIAQFTQQYQVTLNANPTNGGTMTGAGYYNLGAQATITATANTGFVFDRWTINGETVSTNASYVFAVNGNVTAVAHFLARYNVALNVNPIEGGNVQGNGTYTQGETVTITAIPNQGYVFDRWTDNGYTISNDASYSFEIEGHRNITAHFLKQHTITLVSDPLEGGELTGAGVYSSGQQVTLTATANQNYSFVRWTIAGQTISTAASFTYTVTDDVVVTAHFTPTYTISITHTPEEGGTVQGSGVYNAGEQVTISASANEGFIFDRWMKDGQVLSTTSVFTFVATEHAEIIGVFMEPTAPTYVVTLVGLPQDAGVLHGAGTYEEGSSVIVSAVPAQGYSFSRWMIDDETVAEEPTYSFVISDNVTLVAEFVELVIPTYTITLSADPEEGGSVYGAGVYDEGEQVAISCVVHEDYKFDGWSLNGEIVSLSPNYSFPATEDIHLVAIFHSTQQVGDVSTNDLIVYPNPASDHVRVASGAEVTQFEIIAQDGRRVMKQRVWGNNLFISLSDLDSGMYMLALWIGDEVIVRRIVVQ